jgi:hypothetical protein
VRLGQTLLQDLPLQEGRLMGIAHIHIRTATTVRHHHHHHLLLLLITASHPHSHTAYRPITTTDLKSIATMDLAPDTTHFVTHSRFRTLMLMCLVLWRRV